ncbi:hypothetical protein GF337_18965 [candidate division KSB1 bacterium]|nr:hypothetical protein [candidate division KSB1 bacterium]
MMKSYCHILLFAISIFLPIDILSETYTTGLFPLSVFAETNQNKKIYTEPKTAAWNFIEKYCPDGFYVLQQYYSAPSQFEICEVEISLGEHLDYGKYIHGKTEQDIIRALSTIVHEVSHGYASRLAWKALQDQNIAVSIDEGYSYYYLGDRHSILVKETPVFKSHEIHRIFPAKLQTNRYETYIHPSDPMMGTQQKGIYGLLDELAAYYHGTKVSIDLYDYYKSIDSNTGSEWLDFLEGVGATYFAYKEFKLYILQYLIYAEQYQPDMYREIIDNQPFVTAFLIVNEKFDNLIQRFYDLKDELTSVLQQKEIDVYEENDYLFIGPEGRKMFHQDYEKLQAELQKDRYRRLMNRLKQRSLERLNRYSN